MGIAVRDLGFASNPKSMAARWDWGVGICDFWDLQANPKEAHDSWDLANPKVGIWDFGAFGTSRRLLGFHLGFWGLGL